MEIRPRLIFRGDHLEVLHQEGWGDTLFVTFNARNMRGGGRRFWGDGLFERLGLPALGIVSATPNWFPADAMRDLVRTIGPWLSCYRRVVTFGASMGGYGALRYAALLGADHAIAFSPQWSIDPSRLGKFGSRYGKIFDPHLHRDVTIRGEHLPPRSYVLADPYHPWDAFCARQIDLVGAGTARLLPVFHVGHAVSSTLAGTERMSVLLAACDRDDLAGLRALIQSARGQHRSRIKGLALHAVRRRRHRTGLAIYAAHAQVVDAPMKSELSRALMRFGRPDEGVEWARSAYEDRPQDIRYRRMLMQALMEAGRLAEAVAVGQGLEADTVTDAQTCLVSARIGYRLRDLETSKAWILRGVALLHAAGDLDDAMLARFSKEFGMTIARPGPAVETAAV